MGRAAGQLGTGEHLPELGTGLGWEQSADELTTDWHPAGQTPHPVHFCAPSCARTPIIERWWWW